MTDIEPLDKILSIMLLDKTFPFMRDMGEMMFKMFSEKGFPPDTFLSELEKRMPLTQDQKFGIINVYLGEMTAHKLKAGIGQKRLEKLQEHNKDILKRFLKTGEVGIY